MSYIVRAISLAVRLFANMMSGHTLLKILAGFGLKLSQFANQFTLLPAIIPIIIVFLITGLELGIAALQAYVFTILSIMYLSDSLNLH
jgi:F0F1-type ATP synthase membrane subunit a